MRTWKERTLVYKVGFIGANLATLVFIVSFCVPTWAVFGAQNGVTTTSHSLGLWQICTKDLSMCKLALHSSNPGWLKAVRALECIAMFFAVASSFIGLYCNFILKAASDNLINKNMETACLVAVAFASFGLIMFASQIHKYYSYNSMGGNVWWGYVLAWVATALLMLSACMMLISHKIRLLAELRASGHVLGGGGGQFAHRQFSNSSFHSTVRLPDYSESAQHGQVFSTDNGDAGTGHGSDIGVGLPPPAYETIAFNCEDTSDRGSEEPLPPPYSQVVNCDVEQGDPPNMSDPHSHNVGGLTA